MRSVTDIRSNFGDVQSIADAQIDRFGVGACLTRAADSVRDYFVLCKKSWMLGLACSGRLPRPLAASPPSFGLSLVGMATFAN